MEKGQIIKIISNQYTVDINNKIILCNARGNFRQQKITPLVGDYVLVNIKDKVIEEVLERQNELKRPNVSNVDISLIVTSIKKPDLSLNLLDKLISLAIINNITPIICFTKLDLMDGKDSYEVKKITKYYKSIGIEVLNNKQLSKIRRVLKNKTVVLAGQTGAGKSSLLNKMDSRLELEVGEISLALGRGKHTTRHVELFLVKNIKFLDTPGFSSLDLDEYNLDDIKSSFFEFKKYKCPFKGCNHHKEKECKIKEAVEQNKILKSRYENYLNFGGLK